MKKYTVYFELFGKKMKTTVLASSKIEAQERILSKVKFHKIEPKRFTEKESKEFVDDMQDLMEMFGMGSKPKQ